jgi:hypothetical protein
MNKKASYYNNHVCFTAVRRGDWLLKVSVSPKRVVMIIATHVTGEMFTTKYFTDYNEATDWIERIVTPDFTDGVTDWLENPN